MNRKNVLFTTVFALLSMISLSACAKPWTCSSMETKQTLINIAGTYYGKAWGQSVVPWLKSLTKISGVMTTQRDAESGTYVCSAYIEVITPKAHGGGQIEYMVTTDGSGKPQVRYDDRQMRQATWISLN